MRVLPLFSRVGSPFGFVRLTSDGCTVLVENPHLGTTDLRQVLAWRVGSDHPDALGFELSLFDDRTGAVGLLVRTKRSGNGIKLFHDGGRYRLRVSCNFAAWHLQIEEVSRAEADEMLSR